MTGPLSPRAAAAVRLAEDTGADPFLTKPFRPLDLVRLLEV
jgi:CheY-like chemotaxis protein